MNTQIPLRLLVAAVCLTACQHQNDLAVPPPSAARVATAACPTTTLADIERLQLFPVDNPWNTRVNSAQLDSRSAAIITLLAKGTPRPKADFGSGTWNGAPIGIPYVAVCGDQPPVPITFRANAYDGNYGSESDPGPYPVPLDAPIEGNGQGDSHVIAVDVTNRKLYELYNASRTTDGWGASSGAVFDLTSNARRPDGWTSADASGMSILAGLVRYEEVLTGTIDHALRFTLQKSKVTKGYVFPASHKVNGTNTNASAPTPMGMRLRLKAGFNMAAYSPTNRIILNAMKTYGIFLTDIGSDFYFTGAPDERWNNDDLNKLRNLRATDFEVVKMGTIK